MINRNATDIIDEAIRVQLKSGNAAEAVKADLANDIIGVRRECLIRDVAKRVPEEVRLLVARRVEELMNLNPNNSKRRLG